MISIAAASISKIIGKGGGLPWPKISEDFKFFKSLTLEREYCLVGKTTFLTIPNLKGRKFIVVTNDSSSLPSSGKNMNGAEISDVISPQEMSLLADLSFVCIGGAKTYEAAFPYCSDFFLTIVKHHYTGDVELPKFTHLFKPVTQIFSNADIDIIHYARR